MFADVTKEKFSRTWYASDFHLWPNDCEIDNFQKAIDSSGKLPGKTLFILDNPYKKANKAWSNELRIDSLDWSYCLTQPLTFKYGTTKKKEPWLYIVSYNIMGVSLFTKKTCPCEARKEKIL
jgi:hypothetical protein